MHVCAQTHQKQLAASQGDYTFAWEDLKTFFKLWDQRDTPVIKTVGDESKTAGKCQWWRQ